MLAVSDGVGACAHADLGSRYAVEAVRTAFLELSDSALNAELPLIAKRVVQIWQSRINGGQTDEYCATLKAAIKIQRKLFLLSIGDGLLAMTSRGTNVIAPADINLFSNQTKCLNGQVGPSDFWTQECQLDYQVPFTIFACTDGVANNIQEGRELELVQDIETNVNPESLKSELEMLVVDISEYSADDRTIGVVRYERKNAKPGR